MMAAASMTANGACLKLPVANLTYQKTNAWPITKLGEETYFVVTHVIVLFYGF